eukprot:TRINITY_DN10680_c0_g2_i1.p1 TRINITY_DN10680_c0_g2~~TRINITY_DN10680_c0_g2_i1.p1  ORF type:complete len:544 (+),score=89.78 TRINITY_DN10680_c0_g2_i1:32-1633(+)
MPERKAPGNPLWRLCTFNNAVFLVFALYCFTMGRSIWQAFYPPVHKGPRDQGHPPLWNLSTPVDIRVYRSDTPTYLQYNQKDLVASFTGHILTEEKTVSFTSVQEFCGPRFSRVLTGQPLYAHVLVTQPERKGRPGSVLASATPLTVRQACRKNESRTLLSASPAGASALEPPRECVFLKPKLMIRIVTDGTVYPPNQVPPDVVHHTKFFGNSYQPVLWVDETWLLPDALLQLETDADASKPFAIEYRPTSLGIWRLLLRFDFAMHSVKSMLGDESEEADNLRRMFTETHPALLLTTLVVTVLHTLFDVLAFKNDINFWRSRTTMEGLSANNVVAELVCQIIILVYLWDTNSGGLILVTMAAGVVIQAWKTRVALQLQRKSKESNTARADAKAMKWLSFALYPFVIGYAVYSLLYKEHKRWSSWAIESMASAVYAFGFVLMTPQLYINYKLKSVAQLPWRVFGYRALNTFIDDLFAFIIRMPTMHRLSTFRDDVIFLVYLYQRWLYPVDHTRPTEGFDEDAPKLSGSGNAKDD